MTENGTIKGLEMVPIHSTRLGEKGDVILMMHGWGQTQDSLRILADLLSKWYQIYLIDLPGFGKSPKPQADWDTIQYAERIAHFIEEENLSSVHLLGHSFGGRVGIRLASRYPDKVKSLILVNSHGLQRPLSGSANFKSMRVKSLRNLCKSADRMFGSKTFENWFVPKYGSRDYVNAGAMRNIMVKTVTEDATADAKAIKAPAFLLWGEEDKETPIDLAYRFRDLIENSSLVVMPGKDHFPFIDEGAHLCASYILRFLRALPEKKAVVVADEKES